MTQLNAFVARSFDPDDEQRIRPVLDFLDTFRKAGFFCETAEAAEVESVSKKVRRMIDERDVFIGFFTQRNPVYAPRSKVRVALEALLGKAKPQSWTAPGWVLQESGYALSGDRKLILLRESGVEVPGLQGDLEYVPFDANDPAAVFSKLSEMINGLLAEAAGTTVSLIVTQRQEQTQVAIEATVSQAPVEAPNEAGEGPDLTDRFTEMLDAAKNHDLHAVAEAWRGGRALIPDAKHEGLDQVRWDSFYFENRFLAGATDALEDLKRLRDQNPSRFEPKRAMAQCYYASNEFDSAASIFLEVADSQEGHRKARNLVKAAKAFRETKRYAEATEALNVAVSILPDDLRDEVISLQYELLKERGDDYLAFATAEAALHENPQLPVRFNLGLDYRLKDLNEIALYHFKFLYDRNNNNSASLHNLALLSADCKMPIAAVKRYKTAFGLGETLSASNLGYLYLGSGMAEEAKALIDEAMKVEYHDPAVEKCLAEIMQRREHEEATETEILKQAAERRGYFLDMGRALSAQAPPIDGRWMFPFGEMPLSVMSGEVHGSADVKRRESALAALMLGTGGMSGQTAKVDIYVLSGKLTGAVCEFQMTIGEKGEHGTPGVLLANPPSKFGFIVFASDGESATYVELSDSKLGKTEIIKKRSETSLRWRLQE
jgi:tetratricopeptide (TPR) repeat protein